MKLASNETVDEHQNYKILGFDTKEIQCLIFVARPNKSRLHDGEKNDHKSMKKKNIWNTNATYIGIQYQWSSYECGLFLVGSANDVGLPDNIPLSFKWVYK